MRNVAILGLLVALVALAAGASAGEPVSEPVGAPTVGVQYVWQGSMGTLSIANAQGLPFTAWASNGVAVAQGVVPSPMMSIGVPNTGLRNGTVLTVRVGQHVFAVSNDEWIWD
jgi:hypothetical protein